jgi:hypothetical protein
LKAPFIGFEKALSLTPCPQWLMYFILKLVRENISLLCNKKQYPVTHYIAFTELAFIIVKKKMVMI